MKLLLENALLFKKCVDAIAVLIGEAEFIVNNEGIELRATDPSQISMVDFVMPKKSFKEFNVQKQIKLGLDIDYLAQIISRANKNDSLLLLFDEQKNSLKIIFEGDSKRTFNIPLIDISQSELPKPNINFDCELRLNANIIKDALKDAELISSHVTLNIDKKNLTISATSSKGTMNNELSLDKKYIESADVKNECKSMFPLSYLQNILKAAEHGSIITLYLKTDAPIKITYNIEGSSLTYFLAPRIESE